MSEIRLPQRTPEGARQFRAQAKADALAAYGGSCFCCGETDLAMLTLDHANDDGGGYSRGGNEVYQRLRREGFPQGLGLRVACHNCNAGRHLCGGVCPHQGGEQPEPANSDQRRFRRLKVEMIAAYGGECSCCGESHPALMTIEHTRGDGAEHRRQITGTRAGGHHVYRWLKQHGYPRDGFRLLCWNCNDGSRVNGGSCPHEV